MLIHETNKQLLKFKSIPWPEKDAPITGLVIIKHPLPDMHREFRAFLVKICMVKCQSRVLAKCLVLYLMRKTDRKDVWCMVYGY